MTSRKPREDRRPVSIKARLRGEHGWRDVTLANVSSRGLLLRCASPPPRGSFIEVRCRDLQIIGRIAWAGGDRAGVRTRERIDIARLLAQTPPKPRKDGEERRGAARSGSGTAKPTLAARAEASQRWARLINWVLIAVGGVAAAGFVAGTVATVLREPMSRVSEALGPPIAEQG